MVLSFTRSRECECLSQGQSQLSKKPVAVPIDRESGNEERAFISCPGRSSVRVISSSLRIGV